MSITLFDKYGGFKTFGMVVSCFYQKVLDSEQLAPYFENVNMEKLISHQTNFLSKALGGPDKYKGLDLKSSHARLNITENAFNETVELLEEALEEGGVEKPDISTIISLVASLKDQIVSV